MPRTAADGEHRRIDSYLWIPGRRDHVIRIESERITGSA
jgi:acyl-coenzyme A synthetase/AMP-(fatty) acid ligase